MYFNLNFHHPLGIHLGLRISWILSSIAYPIALVITIIYWWMIYDGSTGFRLYNNINCHAVQVNKVLSLNWFITFILNLLRFVNYKSILFQTIIALGDVIVSSRPWKIGHFYFLIIYSAVYILFQVVYIVCFDGINEVGLFKKLLCISL